MLTQNEVDSAVMKVTGGNKVLMYVPARNESYVVEPDGPDRVVAMDGETIVGRMTLYGGKFVVVEET